MPTDEFYELNRTTSKVVAVEQGIFHITGDEFDEEVDLPEEARGGAFIELTVVHAVQMVNGAGEIFVMHFDVPKAKDVSDNEVSFASKTTKNVDGGDNEMQDGKVDNNQVDLGNSMKGLLDIGENT